MRARWTVIAFTMLGIVSSIHAQDSVKPFGLSKRVPWTTSTIKGSPEPPAPYRTEIAFPNLKFNEPLEMAAVPGSNRLFVGERFGKIVSFENNRNASEVETFLDLGKMIYGFTPHPKFATNRQLFVCYIVDPAKEEPHGTRVSRFQASADDPLHCDKQSEQVIFEWPSGGHNGGCMRFGPDGMLYIGTGDSSGIADMLLTGQNLADVSGSILRIDVDHPDRDRPYSIPSDNPFVETPGARGEVWAYGLRQPWKFHFDPATGDLWTGNVGQDLWEQIFLVERGGNYGWSVMEGSHPFRPERPRGPSPFLPPVVEHDHAEFRSITGGTVYHGSRLPKLQGNYIYGDYDTGKVWAFRYDRQRRQADDWRELFDSSLRIVGFGEDLTGELYLIDHMSGRIYQLAENKVANTASNFPRRLSQTGLFASVPKHELAAGIVPYSVNAPQWCDGASKVRFLGVPGTDQIEFETVTYPQPAPGSLPGWKFPDGTVIAETLSLEMEAGKVASRRRIETRILHYEQLPGSEEVGDQFWRSYTYAWNDEQTDAELVSIEGADRTFTIADQQAPGGKRAQTWHYPSRAECVVCHNMAAKYVLGLNTIQVNRDHDYGSIRDNQLRALGHAEFFKKPLPKSPEEMPSLVDYRDDKAKLDLRARAYLHANCSHCHRKWGGGNTDFQLLATLEPPELGIVGVKPAHGGFYLANAQIVPPGDPFESVLLYRMTKLGPGRMPRLGSEIVDSSAVRLMRDWIASMNLEAVPGEPPNTSTSTNAKIDVSALVNDPGKVQELLVSTRGAIQLAITLHSDPSLARPDLIGLAMSSPESHIRDLFEHFLPEDQRPKRLGTAIKADVLLAMQGSAAEGRELFFKNATVQCRNCHKIQGEGTEIGPELTQIGKKYDRRKILENILDPSREIDPKYVVHLAATTDGRLVSGILVERTEDHVVLKDNKNNLLRLPVSEVDELSPQQRSLMPDLLLRDMSAQQVADLLAFLSELK